MINYNKDYSKKNPSKKYKELVELYKELHSNSSKIFDGRSLIKFANPIREIIEKHNCETLLDYGCGKGYLYTDKYNIVANSKHLVKPIHEYWNIDNPHLYDPGEEQHNKLPSGVFDIVINTDVLEHIPEDDLVWVLKEIFNYSSNIVFLNISCRPALKTFKNGENVHVSVFPIQDWLQLIARVSEQYPYLTIYVYGDSVDENNDAYISAYKIMPRPTIIPLALPSNIFKLK